MTPWDGSVPTSSSSSWSNTAPRPQPEKGFLTGALLDILLYVVEIAGSGAGRQLISP